MATRLDRLFLLLETGSTPVVRQSAAEQLGQVQKLHPHELNNLLNKVHKYLCSNLWETRIAAGQAVEAICKNVPQWQPQPQVKEEHGSSLPTNSGHLSLAHFDVQKVLQHAASLLGSEGAEYDTDDRAPGLEDKEKLARQKQLLNKRLGLDMAGNLGIQTEALFDDSDLVVKKEEFCDVRQQQSVAELMQQQMGQDSDMSARERNRAKRKAKLLAKQISREDKQPSVDGTNGEPTAKLRKTASVVVDQPADADKLVIDNVLDNTLNMEEMDEWPFEGFCELLLNDLFSWSWEKRHGACTGLREVLKYHGQGAGIVANTPHTATQYMNKVWLEDAAVRIICVLALDRFGDFVADEVVAPVRETCAQTLGVILRCMDTGGMHGVVAALLKLLGQRQWEVRHGGLLGIKYLLAVRQDQTGQLLPVLLPAVFAGLQDHDDDVRAVAAAALVPVADSLVKHLPQQVPHIISCLWETLTDLDDLTASTNSIMHLLSTLLTFSHPANSSWASQMHLLVPRLWPFLKHNIASVRKSALETLLTLLSQDGFQVPVATWITPILQDALRHLYQRTLLEHKEDILQIVCKVWKKLLEGCLLEHLVVAVGPWLGVWFCFIMQPPKMPFDPSLLIEAKHQPREMNPATARHRHYENQQQSPVASPERKDYIGSTEYSGQLAAADLAVMRARMTAARCVGLLATYLSRPHTGLPAGVETPLESMSKVLLFHLASKSALQRLAVALVVAHWAKDQQPCLCPQEVKERLLVCLSESIYYDEIALGFTRMQTECRDFVASLKQYGVNIDTVVPPGAVLSLDQAVQLCSTTYDQVRIMLRPRHQQTMDERRKSLQVTVTQTSTEWHLLHNRVQCGLACGCVMLQHLPDKLNPVIRPMMEALKKEENQHLQCTVASHLSILLKQCSTRSPNPNAKVVKNLCTMLCSDPAQTPLIATEDAQNAGNADISANCDTDIILTLTSQVQMTGKSFRRSAASKKTTPVDLDIPLKLVTDEEDESKRQMLIQKRGAVLALTRMARDLGPELLSHLQSLWDTILNPIIAVNPSQEHDVTTINSNKAAVQELITSLQVLETILPSLAAPLLPILLQHLSSINHCLKHPYAAVRHMASRAMAGLAKVALGDTMNFVLENVLHSLAASDNIIERQGAIECIANLVEGLGLEVLPYMVLLVVPVLGCMSDQREAVRLMATQCFAALIKLMPLESGIPDPPSLQGHLVQKKEHERQFLEQLLDGSKIKEFSLPIPVKAELRRYQQEGVNWLWFLNQYKLHGILCDDMGLGKTLQSICILAGDHYLREQNYKKSKSADSKPLQSIVVCPPTLTGHWVYEIEKFVEAKYINPLHYTGPPVERTKLQKKIKKHNLVVASYDIVRNDIEFFGAIKWNYCILDEGHIIKNGKTKISKAVKQLVCNHRLILSGTPIQNNVLELWSLFDFLMPGFLGTEKQFQVRYGRPILQSRDAKSSSKEQEAGALAMEGLHRQVLPFLLRRLKEDVLQDLPPKIIQDYYCDLSPLQVRLYEDFARSRAKKSVDDSVIGAEEVESKMDLENRSHIFQALQYLRKVCNHPALVVSPQHPQYEEIIHDLKRQKSSIRELHHAPKLTALRQLLQDCGIGVGSPDVGEAPVVGQHRVLLFCQLKGMLDIVEHDLLKSQMPSVTYMRLDGTVPAGARHGIVNRFNNDPSIDILLLTTHVGGLGLNLTGADIVIFVEHDWNPMKDLQAMDRAHRIGQKKVVTVYRLITKGTLEEKIMGLQKFKLNIANTVISQENASLASMGTDQLLDLFSLDDTEKGKRLGEQPSSDQQDGGPATMNTVLSNLTELWDDKQYEMEYNLDAFMKSLSKT